jgi:sporulation protein YlmC with PRC-barrel domain
MSLPDIDTALDWRGRNVVDRNGEKIGKFDEIYLDEETSRPEWAAVATGLFGRKHTLIPLSEARLEGDDLQVPFDQEQVKDAPAVDPDDELSQEEERQLYSHYGIDHSRSGSETVLPAAGREGDAEQPTGSSAEETTSGRSGAGEAAEAEGQGQTEQSEERPEHPTGGETLAGAGEPGRAGATAPAGEEGAASGARGSEESERTAGETSLRVGTEVKPRERVRLKKYVVTEEVTKKVPVTREEVRLEREPAGEDEEGAGQVGEGEEQVVLSEEEPVIQEPEETSDQREQP